MDQRSPLERWLWEQIGPPLYYCEECLRTVKVKPIEGAEPEITRPCGHTGGIIAPRKAICVGKGGASITTKARIAWGKAKASVTGRNA